jgi:hypothetical protein
MGGEPVWERERERERARSEAIEGEVMREMPRLVGVLRKCICSRSGSAGCC